MQADPGNVNQVIEQVGDKATKLAKLFAHADQAILSNLKSQATEVSQQIPGKQKNAIKSESEIAPVPSSVPASYEKVSVSVRRLAEGFAVAQAAVMTLQAALRTIAQAASGFIEVNSSMETLQMQYEVLIGTLKKAKELFADTKKFADKTPFNDTETYRAGQQLLAAQIKDRSAYNAALRTSGDLAAASGRSINETAGAYARLKSGATGEAMEALRQMNISRAMFEAKGIRFDASGQAMATAKQLTETLDSIVSDSFGGLTEKLSTKWTGLWSTFTSNAANASRSLTGGVFAQLESALDSANKSLDALLNAPEQRFKRLGDGIASLTGAIGQANDAFGGIFGKGALSAMEIIGNGMAMASLALSTFAYLSRIAATALEFLWNVMSLSGNAKQNFVTNMQEATSGYTAQFNLIKGALGLQKDAVVAAAEAETVALKGVRKERNDAAIKAVEANKTIIADLKVVQAVQNSLWAVEKAKGRDAAQLAQMEMEQLKLNLETLQKSEAEKKAAIDANVAANPKLKGYEKSNELLEAESKYAQSIEKYYDALIAKQETLGEFITQTNKLLAEADAIDKRGGDSGVKRYEALKTAVDEYLDGLKKMRDAQGQAATNSAKMTEAAKAAQSGNLTQYQNAAAVIDQGEKMFQISALQERLAQIQQLSQAQNLGARERFSLYEQEQSVFAELTGSIGSAIDSTMQKIQSLQSAALGAASSAVGMLDKVKASKSAYNEVADMVRGMNLDYSKLSLSQLGQLTDLSASLKKKGVNASDIMPNASTIMDALRKEFSSAQDTISKLQTGLQSLIGLSAQIGAQAADGFWKPWETKLAALKAQIASLGSANLNPLNYAPPPVQIPESSASKSESKPVQINAQTSLNIQGSTLRDVEAVVQQAKERFGEELYAALQEANSQYGFS